MEGHIRWIYDWLREYGATDLVLEAGGKHQKLRFVFKGKKHWHLVPHNASTDVHARHNNEARLRRLLGPPVVIEKTRRTLEEMMDELNEKTDINVLNTTLSVVPSSYPKPPNKTWQGTVAAYKNTNVPVGCQLYFVMPADIASELPSDFKIIRLDDEHWKLSPGGRIKWQNNGLGYKTKKCVHVDHNTSTPFASSPAEAVLVDGEILIHQAKDRRVAAGSHPRIAQHLTQGEQRVMKKALLRSSTLLASSGPEAPTKAKPLSVETRNRITEMETQMREIIRQVQVLEALCPYRLVRLESNRLIWRAPTIE